MQVTQLRLENYVGVLEGTGRSLVEVDFRPAIDGDLRKVFLFGRNGSSKSTILAAITPFPENFDGRSELIAAGKPGLKEIEFLRPDGRYVLCEHRWSDKGKVRSFMYISDASIFSASPEEREQYIVPITSKGNVTDFRTEVATVLGITKRYMQIGRVGSSVNSLIKMGPTDRKTFIGDLMPSIVEWQQMHKNASQRVTLLGSELKGLQKELDRIEPQEKLQSDEARASTAVRRLRDEVSELDLSIGEAEGARAEIERARDAILGQNGVEAADGSDFNPLRPLVQQAQAQEREARSSLDRLFASHQKLREFGNSIEEAAAKRADMQEKVARCEARHESAVGERQRARVRLDEAIREQQEAQASLKDLSGSGDEITKLTAQRIPTAQRATDLTAELATQMAVPDGLTYDAVRNASEALLSLKSEIESALSNFDSKDVLAEALRLGMSHDAISAQARRYEEQTRAHAETLSLRRTRLGTVEAHAQFYKQFEGRHCTSSSCPHERHIERFSSAPKDLDEKKQEIIQLEKRRESTAALASSYKSAANGARALHQTYSRVSRHSGTYRMLGLSELGSFESFCAMASGELRELSIDPFVKALAVRKEHAEVLRQLQSLDERLDSLRALQAAEIRLREEADRTGRATERLREEFSAAEDGVARSQETLRTHKKASDLLLELEAALTSLGSAKETLREVNVAYSEVEALRGRWEECSSRESTQRSRRREAAAQLSQFDASLAEVAARIARRREYSERVLEVQGRLEKTKAIADGCHPAKGAPVHFIQGFLDRMRSDVNSMLDEAFGGEFRLDFHLSESEFSIPVTRGSGRVIRDVSEASEGQRALAEAVINLVLVQQTLLDQNGYNIVSLDEVDGTLDKERNRDRFAQILDRFIESMGIEQAFVISHNDAFHASPAALVLLPGHSMPVDEDAFMSNKLVLADMS